MVGVRGARGELKLTCFACGIETQHQNAHLFVPEEFFEYVPHIAVRDGRSQPGTRAHSVARRAWKTLHQMPVCKILFALQTNKLLLYLLWQKSTVKANGIVRVWPQLQAFESDLNTNHRRLCSTISTKV